MRSVLNISTTFGLMLLVAGCASGGGSGGVSTEIARQDASVGDAALNAGNPEVALRLADDALGRNRNDAGSLVRRGMALTELGRLDDARETLRKAVTIDPHDAKALLAFGRVQLPVDPAGAEASFLALIRQDGQSAAALNDLGIARDLQGRHAEAEVAYRSALGVSPGMAAAQVNLALCLAIRGQGTEAVGLLRPLADSPAATRKVKEDFAAVLAMTGDRQGAEHILSANLDASEVAPALEVLASLRGTEASITR